MIPCYRVLEVVLYSVLNFLPFLALAMYPFRKQMRFSPRVTNAMVVLITLLQIVIDLTIVFTSFDAGLLQLITTSIYAAFYFAAVRDHLGKLTFTMLVLSNVGNLVSVISKFLEGLIFGSLALEANRWSLCLCMVAVHLVITLPLFFYIKTQYAKIVQSQLFAWNYLWGVPVTFYMIWFYHLYLTGQSSPEVALNVSSVLFLLLINLGAFLVYHTEVLLLLEKENVLALNQQNHLLTMQTLQYDNLQNRIDEARQAKHDVRHHAYLIREYLRSGKLQELDAYLDNYCGSLPDTQTLVHCHNPAANALLSFFAQQAQNSSIDMDIFVQLPETLCLPDTALSVVLGNLLENALEACRRITEGERKITIRGKAEMGSVFFEITNTFEGVLRRNKEGKILSTKPGNHGLGLDSVSQLVKANGGILELEENQGIFRASVLLMEQPAPTDNPK